MSSRPARLLAKSSAKPDRPAAAEQLRGHTALVVESAKQLLSHRAKDALEAAGLAPTFADRLHRWVLTAAFVHDLGKCSDHFQQMVRHERHRQQLIRHEACSLLLAWPGQVLADWLVPAVGGQRELRFALIAAAGHHRKFWSSAIAPPDAGAGTELTLLTAHDDFALTLRLGTKVLGIQDPPLLHSDISLHHGRRSAVRVFFDACEEESENLCASREEQVLLAIAKALVLDADVAGSAMPRSDESPDWIGRVLARPRDPAELDALVEQRLGGDSLRPFQAQVAASRAAVTLVRAGCGTGKTVAAYKWAAYSHPGRTLWVTYPTTGTATEGFRDYVHEASVRGRLEHGRALVDIEMFGLDDPDAPRRELDRLDALRAWDMDVVTCTVDTVLGLIQNQRKGLYAFASLCRSAVVFDEIHAYDRELFGALLRFLRDLPGVPALLMTASLPASRLQALQEVVRARGDGELPIIDGPTDLEELPRYVRSRADDVWTEVARTIDSGGKVLCVSNTVNRCVAVADAAPERCRTLVYHSRFRYEDRVKRHGEVIDVFRPDRPPAIAVTTQVAEMSLDLSADFLVTDVAPIPALIQRLGRLNRRSRPEAPRPAAPFLVLEPDGPLPYSPEQLDEARVWLERLGAGTLSQRDLIAAWTSDDNATDPPVRSAWIDGGFHTEAAPLRDATPGITVIREEDLPRLRTDPSQASRLALPMPMPGRAHLWKRWRRAAGAYPVAPTGTIEYDPQRGARWQQ